jgi:vitamin B12 transporter
MHSRLFFFSLILAISFPLFAQQQLSEEIIVTASSLPEKKDETPVAATVITREQLDRREVRDVADALREVPGLAISRTGSPGKNTTLFIRGGSSKQALVLWNGVQINNPYFSGYDFGQLSSAGVEKIEVVRGPFSALYGSEAVSGVVNVLTTPSRTHALADVEGGEKGLLNGALSGAYVAHRWNGNATVEHRQDDGFARNDDFESTSLLGGITFTPVDGFSAGVLARHTSYDLGVPRNPNAAGTAFVPSLRRREEGGETQIVVPLRYDAGKSAFTLRAWETRRDDTFSDPDAPFGPQHDDVESTIRGAHGTAQFDTRLGTITAGGEYARALVDLEAGYGAIDERERTNQSFFVEDRLSVVRGVNSSIEITAGVRYDDFDEFGSETSPRLAAALVRSGHKFRAAYGEGFRAPAIGELYFPFGGNVNLGAEHSRNFEIGYERLFASGNVGVTVFDTDYEGLISFGPTYQFENIAAAKARGVELGASRRLQAWQFDASYTWLDTEDEATGDELLRRPEHSGSVAVGYHAPSYSAQLVVTHKGQRNDVTDLFPYGTVINDAHTVADIVVHYRLGTLTPYVKLENLSDESYEEVFGYPSGQRRAVIGLRWAIR